MHLLRHVEDFLKEIQAKKPHKCALRNYPGKQTLSTHDFLTSVDTLAKGLITKGLQLGERVGLLADSSLEWTVLDIAIMRAGGVVVPLFVNLSEEHLHYEIALTEPRWIFADRPVDGWNTLNMDGKELLELGKNSAITLPMAQEESLAMILFTSGSTGLPKGVELTQRNRMALINDLCFKWDPLEDHYLSILPLAHIFASTLNLILLGNSVPITYADPHDVVAACQEVRPTVMIVVPRILEKAYAKMQKKIPWWLPLKFVARKLRNIFGGKMRVLISGGAHLSGQVQQFFLTIGVPIYEGWGLTEASTVLVNQPGRRKVGTVGLTLGDLEVSLDPEGELLVRGSTVMRGYYKDKEATEATFTPNGWLRTGDLASIDTQGYVTIIGRMDDLCKTSTGEFVSPDPIEQLLKESPQIDHALIIAEGCSFVTCLLFVESDASKSQIKKQIAQVNTHLDDWEQIVDHRLVTDPLTVAGGDLTPTLKIRRNQVLKKYDSLIKEMY